MTKIQYPRPFSSKTSEQGDPLEKQVMVDQTVTTIEEDIGLATIKVVGVGGVDQTPYPACTVNEFPKWNTSA